MSIIQRIPVPNFIKIIWVVFVEMGLIACIFLKVFTLLEICTLSSLNIKENYLLPFPNHVLLEKTLFVIKNNIK